jgi:hypothetical protein
VFHNATSKGLVAPISLPVDYKFDDAQKEQHYETGNDRRSTLHVHAGHCPAERSKLL